MKQATGNVRHKSRGALLLVDVINHFEFPDGKDILGRALAIAPPLARLKKKARAAGIPTIYVNDNFGQWRSDTKRLLQYCLRPEAPGLHFVEQLQPDDDDYFILKPMHSAFYQTPLDLLLRELGASSIILSGLATNSCILCTAHDAYMRHLKVIVPRDCAPRARRGNTHRRLSTSRQWPTRRSLRRPRRYGLGHCMAEKSTHDGGPRPPGAIIAGREGSNTEPPAFLSNAEIADRLASLAQLLSAQKENPYKVKAYQRAAAKLRNMSESLQELVQGEADLTQYAGIGDAIASAIREIVQTGSLRKLETLRAQATPAVASINAHPRLDPKRVQRVYMKLGISSVEELREKLDSGEIERALGLRMAQHVRQGLTETHAMLLYRADDLRTAVEEFLLGPCRAKRAEVVGEVRRRTEVIEELAFVIETDDFPAVVAGLQRYGGRTPLVSSGKDNAVFALSSGVLLRLQLAGKKDWGLQMVACTGSKTHLKELTAVTGPLRELKGFFASEQAFYRKFGLQYIEPELREGYDEVERAAKNALPTLLTAKDIKGELHAHSTSSDGSDSIEDMAEAARERGYEYIGISDHSQSLKIARGVSVEDLWAQIKYIDKLNSRLRGFRILKSSEVDILADGSLDYPDDLLRELDYTVCSIHSRFGLDRQQQTERLLRAMDNRYFNILGHATGRLLLKRPGYELNMELIIEHARKQGCFFEINSSPDRLDLSVVNARAAMQGGAKVVISTDAHILREFGLVRYGLDQARRAGLTKDDVLNCLPWSKLCPLMKR